MSTTDYRFDFALSFAGAQRGLAEQIRDALRHAGKSVFYDRDFEQEMLGQDGSLYLRSIYSRESRHCLVLVSREYDAGQWTQLERESIQARELRGERGILIPIVVDGHRPSWLPATRIYFEMSRGVADLVEVLTRLLEAEREPRDDETAMRSATVHDLIRAKGCDFVRQCRSHLTLAVRDGYVRIRLGYPSLKTEAGRFLIDLGALTMLDPRPTGKIGSKYQIMPLGVDVLHRLREE